ncbi:MAG: metal-dependent hydrolase [Planctomycetia bacterium]|nr:metal-dependent hydrolase [Planctomycetia bacterium]
MAGFQGHITTSTTLGIGLGFVGHWSGVIPDTSCLLAAGLCSFSGMLPDLDSVKSRQHREIIGFLGAVVAAFTIQRLSAHMTMESATAIACLVYLAIRFGVSWFIRVSTYHRGMFHSIPAAILAGELAFLLMTGGHSDTSAGNTVTLFKTSAVVLGYLSHLVLDELCSVASHGKIQVKSSLGTALKWFGRSALANFAMMVLILLLADPIATRWQDTETAQIATTNEITTDTENKTGVEVAQNPTDSQNVVAWETGTSVSRGSFGTSSQSLSPEQSLLSEPRSLLSLFSRGTSTASPPLLHLRSDHGGDRRGRNRFVESVGGDGSGNRPGAVGSTSGGWWRHIDSGVHSLRRTQCDGNHFCDDHRHRHIPGIWSGRRISTDSARANPDNESERHRRISSVLVPIAAPRRIHCIDDRFLTTLFPAGLFCDHIPDGGILVLVVTIFPRLPFPVLRPPSTPPAGDHAHTNGHATVRRTRSEAHTRTVVPVSALIQETPGVAGPSKSCPVQRNLCTSSVRLSTASRAVCSIRSGSL